MGLANEMRQLPEANRVGRCKFVEQRHRVQCRGDGEIFLELGWSVRNIFDYAFKLPEAIAQNRTIRVDPAGKGVVIGRSPICVEALFLDHLHILKIHPAFGDALGVNDNLVGFVTLAQPDACIGNRKGRTAFIEQAVARLLKGLGQFRRKRIEHHHCEQAEDHAEDHDRGQEAPRRNAAGADDGQFRPTIEPGEGHHGGDQQRKGQGLFDNLRQFHQGQVERAKNAEAYIAAHCAQLLDHIDHENGQQEDAQHKGQSHEAFLQDVSLYLGK